jgi:hypothetical protein
MKTRRGSDTEVGRRMLGSLTSDYNAKVKEVRKRLDEIDKALKEHGKQQRERPDNRGYLADVEYVFDKLGDVIRFIRNYP